MDGGGGKRGEGSLITYLFLCLLCSFFSRRLADFISPIIEFTCLFCQWVPINTTRAPGAAKPSLSEQRNPNPQRDLRFIQNFEPEKKFPRYKFFTHAVTR